METKTRTPSASSLAMLALVATVFGCAQGPVKPDPAVAEKLRETLVLAEEPDGVLTPLDLREAIVAAYEQNGLSAEDGNTPAVLIGRVGGMPNPWPDSEASFPWRDGEATFFLVDPATADEFAEHADEQGENHAADCPFCAREAAAKSNAVAAISFSGENGQPLQVDARELFGLQNGDTVVVRGIAKLLGGELLTVEADGLFRR